LWRIAERLSPVDPGEELGVVDPATPGARVGRRIATAIDGVDVLMTAVITAISVIHGIALLGADHTQPKTNPAETRHTQRL